MLFTHLHKEATSCEKNYKHQNLFSGHYIIKFVSENEGADASMLK